MTGVGAAANEANATASSSPSPTVLETRMPLRDCGDWRRDLSTKGRLSRGIGAARTESAAMRRAHSGQYLTDYGYRNCGIRASPRVANPTEEPIRPFRP